jgi:hypothetical protein
MGRPLLLRSGCGLNVVSQFVRLRRPCPVLRFLLAELAPMLTEALAGLSGTTLTSDVVTLINRFRLVTSDLHRFSARNAGLLREPNSGPASVMKKQFRHPRCYACLLPSGARVFKRCP